MNQIECCVCGTVATKETKNSPCDWSSLGNHHWVNSETGKDVRGVKQF